MYNKIIRKYYLFKIFTLSLPLKQSSNASCYFLCKYYIRNTPYTNLYFFTKEIAKIFNVLSNNSSLHKLLFFCSEKLFFLNSILSVEKKLNSVKWKQLSMVKKVNTVEKTTLVVLYNLNLTNKLIWFFKDLKIPTIGFIDAHNQPNLTDYTLFLEARHFFSLFLFHFVLKRILLYVKN